MKSTRTFFLVFLFITHSLVAQNPNKVSCVQAIKIAFLTKELNLTSEDAQKFWPVYNAYLDELKKTKKDAKDDVLAFEERALAVKKKYSLEFKRILQSDERANKVFLADRNFTAFIKKELQERQRLRSQRLGFGELEKGGKQQSPQTDN